MSRARRLSQLDGHDTLERVRIALGGRYEVDREIGRGSAATVFLARDVLHDRPVAIKVLRQELPAFVGADRFLREIRIAAQLTHPHILSIHDSGEAGNLLYYVMPYVDGESLRSRLRRETQLDVGDAVRLTLEIADALDFAHQRGVVHRDVKPENVLLSGTHAYLADFGIAASILESGEDERLTESGISVGTPAYMSPEQASGEHNLSPRSDIYSLACLLYEMLTGEPPFTGPTAQIVRSRHLSERPKPISASRPNVPLPVERAVHRALEKMPADRFATAADFAEVLRDHLTLAPTPSPAARIPARAVELWRSWPPRAKLLVGAVAGVLVLGGIATIRRHAGDERGGVAVDPDVYLVLPFAHRAGAAPTLLSGDQCSRLLYDAFSHWSDLRLVDPLRANELRGRQPHDSLTLSRALEQARALGAGRLAWGEVWEFADTVRVRAVLYDVSDGDPLRERSVKFTTATLVPSLSFGDIASSLITRSAALGTEDNPLRTRSIDAWRAYDRGRAAVERWDLAEAADAFRTAIREDSEYAQAHLWLAHVIGWSGSGPRDEWVGAAARAVARRHELSRLDSLSAEAVLALADGQFAEACQRYRALLARDSTSFDAWFGLGECHSRDNVVVRNQRSPSGWYFRSSYEAALQAYVKALSLVPSFQRSFVNLPSTRLSQLLYAETRFWRRGRALPPDTATFGAWPSLDADTLAFVPFPSSMVLRYAPQTRPPTLSAAVARNRELLRSTTVSWTRAFPRSAQPLEALAAVLERTGELGGKDAETSALGAILRARSLARSPLERARLAVTELRIRVKVGDMVSARRLADSLLDANARPSEDVARLLAGAAALTGRATRTAQLLRASARIDTTVDWNFGVVSAPTTVKEPAQALLAFSALGGPADSIRTLAREVERMATAWAPPGKAAHVTDALTFYALGLAFPTVGAQGVHSRRAAGYSLLRSQLALARRDTSRVRREIDQWDDLIRLNAPGDASQVFGYHAAHLLLQLGDTARALIQLDRSLDALGTLSGVLPRPADAATLVRGMALRAELASRAGDRARATRWARAVVALWSGADTFLQPTVERMRVLASQTG